MSGTTEPPVGRRFATSSHLLSLAVAFVALLVIDRRQWFAGDEWDFFVHYDLARHPLDVFLPHNEHLSVLPLLVFKALYATVGLKSYLPYVAILALCHVATAHLIYRLGRRSDTDPWILTALVAVFLFLGAGFFNLTIAFQMSFIGSTAFGIAALLVLDTEKPLAGGRLAVVSALCLGSMLCSGLGPIFTLIAALAAIFRHGRRAAVLAVAVPIAFYAAWFLLVGRHHVVALGLVGKSAYLQLPDFVWVGLTAATEKAMGMTGGGAVFVLALGTYLVWRRAWASPPLAVVAALGLGSVLFLLAIGPGRLVFGPQYAAQSRYVYELSAILLVPAAVALSHVARRGLVTQVVLLAILALVVSRGTFELKSNADQRAAVIVNEKARILAAARLVAQHQPVIAPASTLVQPDDLDITGIQNLVADGTLDVSAAPPDTDPNTLGARLQLETSLAPVNSELSSTSVAGLRAVGISVRHVSAGCAEVDSIGDGSRLELGMQGVARITLTPVQGGKMRLALVAATNRAVSSKQVDFDLAAGRTSALTAQAPGTYLVLSLPAGTTRVCGTDLGEAGYPIGG